MDAYQAGHLVLLAPDLIHAEVGNIACKKHIFQGWLADDARAIIDAFRNLSYQLTPGADLLDDAYRLAIAHRRTVYDAMDLALSVRERCRFITADRKLSNAVGAAYPNLVYLADWP